MITTITNIRSVAAGVMALALIGNVQAGISSEEAARLGKDLTPMGAERAGNEAGTIPEWTGGITEPPAGWKAGDYYANPYAGEKPLFSITAQNVEQYRDNLSEGQLLLLKKYPDTFRMDVYPTHRSAAAPQWVYDNTKKNAQRTELVSNGNGVQNAFGGVPFPVPKEGVEVVWNHNMRYLGTTTDAFNISAVVDTDGTRTIVKNHIMQQFPYYDQAAGIDGFDGTLTNLLVSYIEPVRRKGELILVNDPVNQAKSARQGWQYIPGQRRVRRAPTVAHDTPDPGTSLQTTYDDGFQFNGSPERYDWKLIGKKEVYVPYNNYDLAVSLAQADDLGQVVPGKHVNPDYVRWELHRMWVVEGTLKDGSRHIYQKRRFYVDEDTWTIQIADRYDARGSLWRSQYFGLINTYDKPAGVGRGLMFYDHLSGIYGLAQVDNAPFSHRDAKEDAATFTPQGLRKLAKR